MVTEADSRTSRDPAMSLILYVKDGDPITARACEEVQALIAALAPDTKVDTHRVEGAFASTLPGPLPMLSVQIGSAAPDWIDTFERRSLRRRLLDLGVPLRD